MTIVAEALAAAEERRQMDLERSREEARAEARRNDAYRREAREKEERRLKTGLDRLEAILGRRIARPRWIRREGRGVTSHPAWSARVDRDLEIFIVYRAAFPGASPDAQCCVRLWGSETDPEQFSSLAELGAYIQAHRG